jgi:hypothetical protein
MIRFERRHRIALLILMMAAGFARAQGRGGASGTIEGRIADSQDLSLPATTVDDQNLASKTDIPASDLPVTVDTVSLDMIQQQNLTDIVPAINSLPAAARPSTLQRQLERRPLRPGRGNSPFTAGRSDHSDQPLRVHHPAGHQHQQSLQHAGQLREFEFAVRAGLLRARLQR